MEEAGECGGSAGPAPRRAPLLSAPPLSLSYTGSPGDGPSPTHSSNHAPWLDSREIYDFTGRPASYAVKGQWAKTTVATVGF